MKLLIVGSEGYIGRALCRRFTFRDDIELFRVDPCVYGQPPATPAVQKIFKTKDVVRYIDKIVPDHIVWLGAYAHDPSGRINTTIAIRNNARRVAVALSGTGCPYTAVSSLSVFAEGAYPESKRYLEQALVAAGDFGARGSLLRFGTVFGVPNPGDAESFRAHLLLNRMSIDAVTKGKITVTHPTKRRPVLALRKAVHALERDIFSEGPRGTISNHYDTCGTLQEFAQLVQLKVAMKKPDSPVEIVVPDNAPDLDNRDYGWGEFEPMEINLELSTLIHSVGVYDGADQFKALYGFVEKNEDGTL